MLGSLLIVARDVYYSSVRKILFSSLLTFLFLILAADGHGCASVEPLLTAADKAIERGNLVEAEKLLSQLESADPGCRKILLLRGRIAAARGELDSAVDLFTRYKSEAPTDPEGYHRLAETYFVQGNYRRAEVMSELAVTFGPDHPLALTLRGRILNMKGETAQAVELLKRACQLMPENSEAHFQLGVIFDTYKRNMEAVEQFRKVIGLNPRNPQAFDYLALNLEQLGEVEEVEAAYRRGLEVNEGALFDSFLDYNLGRFLMKQHRLEEAEKHLDRAVDLAPATRAVHYERGKLNLKLQRYANARLDLEKALSLPDPSGFILDLQVYYLLSQAYARLGHDELARKYAELSRKAPVPLQGRERK